VTVRDLRELEIYSNPLISRSYSSEIWPQLTAKAPSYAADSTDLHSIQGYGTLYFRPLVKQRVDISTLSY